MNSPSWLYKWFFTFWTLLSLIRIVHVSRTFFDAFPRALWQEIQSHIDWKLVICFIFSFRSYINTIKNRWSIRVYRWNVLSLYFSYHLSLHGLNLEETLMTIIWLLRSVVLPLRISLCKTFRKTHKSWDVEGHLSKGIAKLWWAKCIRPQVITFWTFRSVFPLRLFVRCS